MSKGLEALYRIANAKNHFKYDTLELMDKDFQIVRQDLLEQEKELKEVKANLTIELNNKKNAIEMFKEERTLRENQEKVLEIIKENNVDVQYLRYEAVNVRMYNDYVSQLNKVSTINHNSLNEEEFDLLKRYCDE